MDKVSPNEPCPTPDCSSFEQLREKYFNDLEDRIRTAPSRKEAKVILDNSWKGLERQCESEMIRQLFKRHSSELLKKYWA
ncbi:hypothetical protein JXA02_14955 [candidate division KSB1 bacterium]|nr:hypothetical protein [candidate division KSB1 bacterium]